MCVVASLTKQLLVCSSIVCGSQFEETTSGMQFWCVCGSQFEETAFGMKSDLNVLMCVVASLKKKHLLQF